MERSCQNLTKVCVLGERCQFARPLSWANIMLQQRTRHWWSKWGWTGWCRCRSAPSSSLTGNFFRCLLCCAFLIIQDLRSWVRVVPRKRELHSANLWVTQDGGGSALFPLCWESLSCSNAKMMLQKQHPGVRSCIVQVLDGEKGSQVYCNVCWSNDEAGGLELLGSVMRDGVRTAQCLSKQQKNLLSVYICFSRLPSFSGRPVLYI